MTLLVINIGIEYANYSLPLIRLLCEYNKINLFVLDNNNYDQSLNPSWLKCVCHDFILDDFIICWDCDLVPLRMYDFNSIFDRSKINLAYDLGIYEGESYFNKSFKYNCGLIGIPKLYSDWFKDIFYNHDKTLNYPSYEQYHVNDKLFNENIHIHLLPLGMNTLFQRKYNIEDYFNNNKVNNVHYTWQINSELHRIELIKKHSEIFALLN